MEIGRLREDLYYRLNVIPIELPPLRKRKEDISILVNYYIKRFCTSNKLETINIDDDAMFALQNYEWPGNIRQLKNVVEQLVSLVEGATIHYKDIPEFITTSAIYKNANINRLSDLPYWEAKKQILMEFEKEYFGNLLKRCNENVTKASQIAQVSRRTFYQKMSAHQLYN